MGYEIQPYAPRGVTESAASPVGMGALPFELTIKNLFLVAAAGAVFVRFVLPSLQKKRKNPRRLRDAAGADRRRTVGAVWARKARDLRRKGRKNPRRRKAAVTRRRRRK